MMMATGGTTAATSSTTTTTILPPPLLRRSLSYSIDYVMDFKDELIASTELLFSSKFNWLLVLGPLAVLGDATHTFGEAMCFLFTGLALIPCAERLSFITEQVAEHTNGTIGALLNATFGNAPELLISVAALRAGYYRVVQLAMLGSMLTNMMLVFGLSCVIGGLRWQVQELRTPSGNVNIVMLLVATAGSLFPAALKLTGQLSSTKTTTTTTTMDDTTATPEEITFCRINACIMLLLYICFLLFQLKTHKEEYDEDDILGGLRAKPARRNFLCRAWYHRIRRRIWPSTTSTTSRRNTRRSRRPPSPPSQRRRIVVGDEEVPLVLLPNNNNNAQHSDAAADNYDDDYEDDVSSDDSSAWGDDDNGSPTEPAMAATKRRRRQPTVELSSIPSSVSSSNPSDVLRNKSKNSDNAEPDQPLPSLESDVKRPNISVDGVRAAAAEHAMPGHVDDDDDDGSHVHLHPADHNATNTEGPVISMRVGIVWLFVITVCVSAMSDILVDTIDEFSQRMHLSQVFTSMVIIPFFSNVAEQVSAFLFAYRNEMDLCVGVTVGSAIQIATFVLPGSVLIGYVLDRPMTLYFQGYETCCLFFCVLVLASVLQGGTTNWMTGAMLVGIYIMIATGIWFHELETWTNNDISDDDSYGGGTNTNNTTRWL